MSFLAGSKVSMADGSLKNIEDLEIGDEVFDYQMNVQTVDGIKSRQCYTGIKVIRVNNKLFNTSCHMFFGSAGDFYDFREDNGRSAASDFKRVSLYITPNSKLLWLWTWGLDSNINLLKEINTGVSLLTINGPEIVTSIEVLNPLDYAEETLYLHSVTGSGSYFVDGYCVSARINESWDYKNHVPYENYTIIKNNDLGNHVFERKFNLDLATNSYPVWDYNNNDWNPSTGDPRG